MADEREWSVDTDGNLSAPGEEAKPPTDEFGRDDPDSIERERRRREREARRGKSRKARKAPEPAPEPAPAPEAPSTVTAEAPRPAKRPKPKEPVAATAAPSGGDGDGGDPTPRAPRGRYRRRRILALGLLLVGVLVAWFLVSLFQPPPFDPGDGSGEAIVTVPEGASASQVADLLTENDVVSNGTLFEWRLKLAGKTDEILPGRYVLAHNMSYGDGDRPADELRRPDQRDHPGGRGPHPDRRRPSGTSACRATTSRPARAPRASIRAATAPRTRSRSRASSFRRPTSSTRGRTSISSSPSSCRRSVRTSLA